MADQRQRWTFDLECPMCGDRNGWLPDDEGIRCGGCDETVKLPENGRVPVIDRRSGSDDEIGHAQLDETGRMVVVGDLTEPPERIRTFSIGCSVTR